MSGHTMQLVIILSRYTIHNWSPCKDTMYNPSYQNVKTLCYWSPYYQDAIHNRTSINKWLPYQDTLYMTGLTTMSQYTAVLYTNACKNIVTSDLFYFTTPLVFNQFHFHHIIQFLQHNTHNIT
jgi:hypothetical protein